MFIQFVTTSLKMAQTWVATFVSIMAEAAESTINTISLIVVFPITLSNYFSKISKQKVKNVPTDSKQY